MAFSPDEKTLATGSEDSTIKLWHLAILQEVATLRGHTGSLPAIAFSPDGNTLATAGADTTIRLWHATPAAETAPREEPTGQSSSRRSGVREGSEADRIRHRVP